MEQTKDPPRIGRPLTARIIQVNVSPGGVPKRAVPVGILTTEGLEGDWQKDRRYHGGPLQALCLFSAELLEGLVADGYPVGPGSLGENLTTKGLTYSEVRVGDVYTAGAEAVIQITKPRGPCTTIQVYGEGIIRRTWGPSMPWGESGFYARVVREGRIHPLDEIRLVTQGRVPAPTRSTKLKLDPAEFATASHRPAMGQ